MKLGERLNSLRKTREKPPFFKCIQLPVPDESPILVHDLIFRRAEGKGTFGIFKPYEVLITETTLVDVEGVEYELFPFTQERYILRGEEFASQKDAKRAAVKKVREMEPRIPVELVNQLSS